MNTLLPARHTFWPLLGALLCLVIVPCRAELAWEKTSAIAVPKLGEAKIEISYRFKNSGSQPVKVSKVETSCGCTTATADRQTYGPGEAGEIRATFTVGTQTGTQQKTISVYTDATAEPVRLALQVNIPFVAQILPRGVMWNRGDAPTPREIAISPGTEGAITVGAPQSGSPALKAELRQDGAKYILVLTPTGTSLPLQIPIRLSVKTASGQSVEETVYASVQ